MTADLSALIARLEAAEVGGRELDRGIWFSLEFNSHGEPSHAPKYSTSLDAVLALAERVLPGCSPGMSQNVHSRDWFAWIGYAEDGEAKLHAQTFGTTPAIALCIAVLKAKQGEET